MYVLCMFCMYVCSMCAYVCLFIHTVLLYINEHTYVLQTVCAVYRVEAIPHCRELCFHSTTKYIVRICSVGYRLDQDVCM